MNILDTSAAISMPLQGRILIEASAGTGKTYTMANLYLRMISEGQPVSRILVVTFTVAATDELRGRIRLRLHQALQALQAHTSVEEDPFLRQWRERLEAPRQTQARLRMAIRSMDEAAIHTIHGFCQRALNEHAFLGRQAFETEMVADDTLLWRQALYDWWRRWVYPMEAADAALMLRIWPDAQALECALRDIHAARLHLLPKTEENPRDILRQWREMEASWRELAEQWRQNAESLCLILRQSPALSRGRNAYAQERLARKITQWRTHFSSGAWWQGMEHLHMLRADVLEKHSKPSRKGSDPALRSPFFLACEQWMQQAEALARRLRLACLKAAYEYSEEQLRRHKRQTGLMSFQDQLQNVRDALHANPALAASLRQRFPMAMIDEFQDTDALQYEIFQHIYRDGPCLLMIGDPKQAIYAFRGGDIFTYLRAAREAEQRWTLHTNWRSHPTLVRAVNHLFSRCPQPFLMQGIDFHPIQASPREIPALYIDEQLQAAVHIRALPPREDGKPHAIAEAESIVFADLACDIAHLLRMAKEGRARLGERGVEPRDIAILVHTHRQASAIWQALQRRGIASITASRLSVWRSEEAEGLRHILQAIATPDDFLRLRRALASNLLDWSCEQLAERMLDERQWSHWCHVIENLHRTWRRHGFMPMFHDMLHEAGVIEAITRTPNAERRLTNVLHLGELLQAARPRGATMASILRCFDEAMEDESSEQRLESDTGRVRIVTIHASKGLEYPIVYLPTLSFSRASRIRSDEPFSFYHREMELRCCDIGSEQRKQHVHWAMEERQAEDIRLGYVALTRARSHMRLFCGAIGKEWMASTAARLWCPHPLQNAQQMLDSLRSLGEEAKEIVHIECIQDTPDQPSAMEPVSERDEQGPWQHASLTRPVPDDWRILSFTALTRHIGHPENEEAMTEEAQEEETTHQTDIDPIWSFPTGSRSGLLLHALLEALDFTGDIHRQVLDLCSRCLPRFGMPEELAPVLGDWLAAVCRTPLHAEGWRLCDIPDKDCLRELEFDFPVRNFQANTLDGLLQRQMGMPLPALNEERARGYMTGSIDLLVYANGRYYVIDYKSNDLGGSLQDYAPDRLRHCMAAHRYDLQAMIYTLALHRHLQSRLPSYDYERHIGGVCYLFLRGMRGAPRQGVYHERFPRELIEACQACI